MDLKRIGKVVNTFGIAGVLKIYTTTNKIDERFKKGKEVIINNNKYIINSFSHKSFNCILLKLEGVTNINEVQDLVNKDVFQDIVLEDGEFFLDDIIGMDVYSIDDKLLGVVNDYREINDIYYFVIENKLVPYIKNRFVEKIDFKDKRVILTQLGEETLLWK